MDDVESPGLIELALRTHVPLVVAQHTVQGTVR